MIYSAREAVAKQKRSVFSRKSLFIECLQGLKASMRNVYLGYCLALFLVSPTHALSLVVGDGYGPWVDKSMPEAGLATDMVTDIFERIGYESVNIQFKPWRRSILETRRGDHAATFPYSRTAEREADFFYSEPLFAVRNVLFSRKSEPSFVNPASLQGKVVCRPQGYAMTVIETLSESAQFSVERPNSLAICFRMLTVGRVDVVVTSGFVGWYESETDALVKSDEIKVNVLPEISRKLPLYLLAPKALPKSAELIERFNKGLHEYEKQGLKRDLFLRFLVRSKDLP